MELQSAPPPIPAEAEQARIDALRRYRILDTLPEQAYDDIVALARQFFLRHDRMSGVPTPT